MLKKWLNRLTLGLVATAASTVLLSTQSYAANVSCGTFATYCVVPTGGDPVLRKAWETKVFAGLQWNFGDKETNLIFGVRRTQTGIDSVVRGAKFDLAVPLRSEFVGIKPVVRIMGVAGNRDVQGELGLGFKAIDWKLIVAGGIQAPYFNAGVNYVFDEGFKPYAGLNTLKRAVAPRSEGGTLTCPTNHPYVLTPIASVTGFNGVNDIAIVNGQTCFWQQQQ